MAEGLGGSVSDDNAFEAAGARHNLNRSMAEAHASGVWNIKKDWLRIQQELGQSGDTNAAANAAQVVAVLQLASEAIARAMASMQEEQLVLHNLPPAEQNHEPSGS